jgi:putative glutamine amidotransferase
MAGVGGLLLTGGPDIDPSIYGASPDSEVGLEHSRELDILELGSLQYALGHDMPVLAICRGMQLLNVAFGGSLLQNIPGHKAELTDGRWKPVHHSIYLSPGSKLAAILGMGGFFRVNSLHHQGLREAQKSPRLLAAAYSLEDGIIEALESPEHSWVVGVQCHPERQDEVPKVFANLFVAFAERVEQYDSHNRK